MCILVLRLQGHQAYNRFVEGGFSGVKSSVFYIRQLIFDSLGLFEPPKICKMLLIVFLKFSPQTDDLRFLQIEKITPQSRNMVFLRIIEKSTFFNYFVHIHPIFIIFCFFIPWSPDEGFFRGSMIPSF